MTLERLTFARAVFRWAVLTHRMRWGEHNALMRNVIARERRIISCEGKDQFYNYELAKRVADQRGRHGHAKKIAYRCESCHQYHIGHASPDVRARERDWKRRREEAYAEM